MLESDPLRATAVRDAVTTGDGEAAKAMFKVRRFMVIGRRFLVVSGNASAGNYEVLDVFDSWREANVYRNSLDGQEGRRSRLGAPPDVCDVRIFETTERV